MQCFKDLSSVRLWRRWMHDCFLEGPLGPRQQAFVMVIMMLVVVVVVILSVSQRPETITTLQILL